MSMHVHEWEVTIRPGSSPRMHVVYCLCPDDERMRDAGMAIRGYAPEPGDSAEALAINEKVGDAFAALLQGSTWAEFSAMVLDGIKTRHRI